MSTPVPKPLGHKAYGHIGHLPGSKRGPGDHGLSEGQAAIATTKPRDRHDTIIVQEKLDGTCVAVAKIEGRVVPLIRAGYEAVNSHYEQHRMFAAWVFESYDLWESLLRDNERIVGEWLAQAHGTRYDLTNRSPFAAFDLMRPPHERVVYQELSERLQPHLALPTVLGQGCMSTDEAMRRLNGHGFYGALDPAEGAVWRVERKGKVDFLAKYVRPDKADGSYLPELSGKEAVWNWRPTK